MILPVLPVSELESGSDHMVSYLIGWGLSLHHCIENIAVCLISGKYLYCSVLLHSKIKNQRSVDQAFYEEAETPYFAYSWIWKIFGPVEIETNTSVFKFCCIASLK